MRTPARGARRVYESFGVAVAVETRGRTPDLRPALPPRTRVVSRARPTRRYLIEARPRRRFDLSADGVVLGEALQTAELLDVLEGDLALHVAASAPRHVFVHAGVVAHEGRALLLPGRSFAGKSTLTARLVAAGATYYSDEYAVLDERGRVLPYPRRMSLRAAGRRPRRVLPRGRGRKPLPVGWVLGLRYESGAALDLEPLSRGRTALLLMDNAVAARVAPARVLPTLRAAVEAAQGWTGVRGDAGAAARPIVALCLSHCA